MSDKIEFYRHDLGDRELTSLRETIDSLFLTLGPRVAEFETRFANYLGADHCIGVSSCTMGMVLALRAFDIGPGDEVITTPMTFAATSNAIEHVGAHVCFADIDPATGHLDIQAVRAAITPKTKAIIVVHLYGQMVDMLAFRQLADEHNLRIIEDAAHAIESQRDGITPGQLGDAATFSFYATKTMTSGDGGAVVVRDKTVAEQLRRLRTHGVTKDAAARHGSTYQHWDMIELGYKANMTDIEAALLLPQIERLDERRQARERRVLRYRELIDQMDDIDLIAPRGTSAHHLFTIRVPVDRRDAVLTKLGKNGVGCTVNYRAVHTLSYYREVLGYRPDDLPCALKFGQRTISLPLWPALPLEDVNTVVDRLYTILA